MTTEKTEGLLGRIWSAAIERQATVDVPIYDTREHLVTSRTVQQRVECFR